MYHCISLILYATGRAKKTKSMATTKKKNLYEKGKIKLERVEITKTQIYNLQVN